MKRIGWLLLFGITALYGSAQTRMQRERLTTLAKVWGFLKYYHPAAAQGEPDWDQELLRMIPVAEEARNVSAFNAALDTWYRSLPPAKVADTPVNWQADSLDRVFTERDMATFGVSKWLKAELLRLYQYRLPGKNRYATRTYNGYYFDHIIHTEDAYDKVSYPDRSMRLLALFRYWNTIAYFYPHRVAHWDRVLTNHIPPFARAQDSAQYRYAVRVLIRELPDAHSFIQVPGSVYYFYPFRIDYIDRKYLLADCDDSIARKWDYRVGDELVAINGKPVAVREKELLKVTTGTNLSSLYRNIALELLKTGDTVLQVTFRRHDSLVSRTVALHSWEAYRRLPKSAEKPLWREVEPGTWYVRFCKIRNADTLGNLFRDIRQARAVIWDMRDYPNYQVTTKLGQYLFPDTTTLTNERNPSDQFPGTFIKSSYFFTNPDPLIQVYKGRLIVLVDEHTQSLSESVAALLQLRANTITMGSQTAGTTGNITWLSLPGALEVSYTGVGVTGLQDGFQQGRGVKIDVPVTLSQAALQKSRDYLLDQAIRYAREH